MKRVATVLVGLIGFFLASAPSAHAVIVPTTSELTNTLDLTSAPSDYFYFNTDPIQTLYHWIDAASTGTGVIDSFVQISSNQDFEQAYNTNVNGTLDNGSSPTFNHTLLLSAVPIVELNGTNYYEFLLDINQNGKSPFLPLDDIQLVTGAVDNPSVTTCNGGGSCPGAIDLTGTPIYRLDSNADRTILLDFSLNHGSGSGDMFMYIPVSAFSGGPNVYLYSNFGSETYPANDGFEEWAVRKTSSAGCGAPGQPACPPPPEGIPEPSSILLLGSGLFGLFGFSASRKRA